ncbi:MAG TPA: aldo/keto reductase [Thermoplasmata archaeon]|nr:aldo/keto reductase [Thermoplasmata archaeon]
MTDQVTAARAGTVSLGDRKVHRLGLGTNRLTDTAPARALLRRAVELEVDFFDTADIYQSTRSETTLGATLGTAHARVVIATKGGMIRAPDGLGVNGHPEHLQKAVRSSLERLKVDCIDLYQLHRVDPEVPIEASVEALREMQEAGLVRRIGLSNVSVDELVRARRIAAIVSVQNRYNLLERQEEAVLNFCEEHSIVFIPWTPVRRGDLGQSTTLVEVARRYGVSPQQVALSWLLRRSPLMLPIPGTLSPLHLEENLAAAALELHDEDFRRLRDSSFPSGPS